MITSKRVIYRWTRINFCSCFDVAKNRVDDTQSLRMWQFIVIACIAPAQGRLSVELQLFASTLACRKWRKEFIMDYAGRLTRFRQQMMASNVDLAFFPISADLQYLTGIPRDMPNFGATLYPGRWMEGAFITPKVGPVIVLPRMTAEFHLQGQVGGDV